MTEKELLKQMALAFIKAKGDAKAPMINLEWFKPVLDVVVKNGTLHR